jgi:hypothetical protein
MKRQLVGLLVFVLAFASGCLLVFDFQITGLPESQAVSIETRSLPASNSVLLTEPAKKEFIAEFNNLPNFEEIDLVESEGKLIEILEEGVYRRSEVVARNGEKWLVLFENGRRYSLNTSSASVKKLETVSWPGDESDARLSFGGKGKPVIALRNIRGLRAGQVKTIYHRPSWKEITDRGLELKEMEDGFFRQFKLNETWNTLRVSKGLTKDGTQVAVLVLEANGINQVVKQIYHSTYDEKDIIGSLLWVGDLDGDGKLDLYFDEFNEKGFTATELHLSTKADISKLVKLVATFGMAGC